MVPACGARVLEVTVATHASALKAHRQNVKRRDHNRQLRSELRNALKDIRAAIDQDDLATAKKELKATLSLIDKMAGRGIIHRNAAARYKSRLQTRIDSPSPTA
jgi:small subunit ribosomal protein S20